MGISSLRKAAKLSQGELEGCRDAIAPPPPFIVGDPTVCLPGDSLRLFPHFLGKCLGQQILSDVVD